MQTTRDRLETMASRFQEARVLITACELDIFSLIGEESKDAAAIAREAGLSARPLERLLNALVAMKILVKRKGAFRNRKASLRHLIADAPEPLLDIMRHRGRMWQNWSRLTTVVRTGRARRPEQSPAEMKNFIKGMSNVAALSAAEAAGILEPELKKARRVIDVGGGPGTYGCTFASLHRQLRVTVTDLPQPLEIARETVAAMGLAKRVRLLPGDIFTLDSLGRGYDLAFVSNFVHCFKPDAAAEVIAKSCRAVRRGGHVAVKEFCLEKEGTAPHWAALFSINMLVADAGDSYPVEQLKEWMADSGLTDFRQTPLAKNSILLVGRKA